jgi:hypothetical protein
MTEASDGKRDFFVSFNQADRDWTTWIAWVLEAAGYSVFFQDWDFRGSFIEQMHQASLHARRTLAVLSDNYLHSEYARSEAWAALARDPVGREDRVVTVKVGSTGDLGLFNHFAYLDLTTVAEADAERLLLERAKRSLDPTYRPKPETRPGFPDALTRHVTEKPRFPGALPPIWNVPDLRNPHFTGRDELLEALHRALTEGPTALTSNRRSASGPLQIVAQSWFRSATMNSPRALPLRRGWPAQSLASSRGSRPVVPPCLPRIIGPPPACRRTRRPRTGHRGREARGSGSAGSAPAAPWRGPAARAPGRARRASPASRAGTGAGRGLRPPRPRGGGRGFFRSLPAGEGGPNAPNPGFFRILRLLRRGCLLRRGRACARDEPRPRGAPPCSR